MTGAAGFIGLHVAQALLRRGERVIGVDSLTPYYDVALKEARLSQLVGQPGFSEERVTIADRAALSAVFARHHPRRVIHLAAQAGVRPGGALPHVYGDANLTGFLNILEDCRQSGCEHLVYASSSSVYGSNTLMPFAEHHGADHPVSLYAATKRAGELMAHSYSHLYGLPTTGLRFFNVYGPWGRPDMAPFLFTKAILEGRAIDLFNGGNMRRDFTYIDDVVEGILKSLDHPAEIDRQVDNAATHSAAHRSATGPFRLYNIGRGEWVGLLDFIHTLESELGRPAILKALPMQPGDMVANCAAISALQEDIGYTPTIPVTEGVKRFVAWYRGYYGV